MLCLEMHSNVMLRASLCKRCRIHRYVAAPPAQHSLSEGYK